MNEEIIYIKISYTTFGFFFFFFLVLFTDDLDHCLVSVFDRGAKKLHF